MAAMRKHSSSVVDASIAQHGRNQRHDTEVSSRIETCANLNHQRTITFTTLVFDAAGIGNTIMLFANQTSELCCVMLCPFSNAVITILVQTDSSNNQISYPNGEHITGLLYYAIVRAVYALLADEGGFGEELAVLGDLLVPNLQLECCLGSVLVRQGRQSAFAQHCQRMQ